jgi:mono/diheme cytochrome c family protein
MRPKSKLLPYLAFTAAAVLPAAIAFGQGTGATNSKPLPVQAAFTEAERMRLLTQYCAGCHNDRIKTADLSVQKLSAADLGIGAHNDVWEKILWRLSVGEMPPKGMPRPPQAQIDNFIGWLESSLDKFAEAHPNPGRATLRRMNRAEYANAVRDLLSLDVDMSGELPVDDSGYGFDNIADVLTVSPTLMDRYVSVAGKVSRLATGLSSRNEFTTQFVLKKDVNVEYHGLPSFNERASDELPLNSRGGGAFKYYAPYDATYLIQVTVNSNTEMDNEVQARNTYEVRVPIKAGARVIGASFEKTLALNESHQTIYSGLNGSNFGGIVMPETPPVPLKMNVQVDGKQVKTFAVPSYTGGYGYFQQNFPRDVLQIVVKGPYDVKGAGDTPSRRKIFSCRPSKALSEDACARKIITRLATQAFRRPVTDIDIAPLMKVFATGRNGTDFEHGIEASVEAILVSPHFLFMQEQTPVGVAGSQKRISDLELATKLSIFLWSSIPDQQLLTVAARNQLRNPAILKQQIKRMLSDPKAEAIAKNFAGQWLYLRNLDHQRPDLVEYPNFDERLRKAMLTETEMFVTSVFRNNSSVLDFLNANYTFLNQRLAEHYGIPGVFGTTFRKVSLDPSSHRGGLLGQGSILTVTSYNNRASVVKRGKWVLDNILAAPPPPPPPDVPTFPEVKGVNLTDRERLDMHRKNPICASCHAKIDPLGFALQNYDGVGAWRTMDSGKPVDASAVLPNGTAFSGPDGLRDVLMAKKDQFVEAFTQRLMTYALGRGLESYDMPAVRSIRRQTVADGYRIDSIVLGIVQSAAFQMRTVPEVSKRSAQK